MIAISHYGAEQDISGVTTWLAMLLEELQNTGHEVALHLEHFGQDGSQVALLEKSAGLGIASSWTARSGDTHKDVRVLLEFLNRVKPKVFLPQCLPSGHYAARLAQRCGLPWAFTLHSDDPAYWALAEHCGPDAGNGVWVAVSEAIAAEARRRFPKADVRVIPYGVYLPEKKAGYDGGKFRVVYSGRLVETQKRVSLVAQALIEACRQSERIEAVVLGDGSGRAAMEDAVRAAGLVHRIQFVGRLSPQEVTRELLQAQSIVLMSDYEGLPVCLLEAMACGVVPVVRDIRSGIPEIIVDGETGFLVNDDPVQAGRRLAALALNPEVWAKVSLNCRSLIADKYSRQASMGKWLQVIHDLAKDSVPQFPIRIDKFPKLPPLDERLRFLDRRPGAASRTPMGQFRRILRGIQRRVPF